MYAAENNEKAKKGQRCLVQRPSTMVQEGCAWQNARLYSGASIWKCSRSIPTLSNMVAISHRDLLNTGNVVSQTGMLSKSKIRIGSQILNTKKVKCSFNF